MRCEFQDKLCPALKDNGDCGWGLTKYECEYY